MPAPSTPRLLLPVPSAADPADVPFDIKRLADRLDVIAAAIPPLVNVLPAGPIDGQECYYIADAANGVIWHLRYRAASASAYKWELVGGRPLLATILPSETITVGGGVWSDTVTPGPIITVPLAGDYDLSGGADFSAFPSSGTWAFSTAPNVGGAGVVQPVFGTFAGGAQNVTTAMTIGGRVRRQVAVAAATAIKLQHSVAVTGAASWLNRWLTAIPARVG